MKIFRYIIGLIAVLSLLGCDIYFGNTMLSRLFYLLIASCLFALLRLAIGATNHDRLLAFKAVSITLVGFCVILAIAQKKDLYIDIAIAWTLQSYIVSFFLSRYLGGGNTDD